MIMWRLLLMLHTNLFVDDWWPFRMMRMWRRLNSLQRWFRCLEKAINVTFFNCKHEMIFCKQPVHSPNFRLAGDHEDLLYNEEQAYAYSYGCRIWKWILRMAVWVDRWITIKVSAGFMHMMIKTRMVDDVLLGKKFSISRSASHNHGVIFLVHDTFNFFLLQQLPYATLTQILA